MLGAIRIRPQRMARSARLGALRALPACQERSRVELLDAAPLRGELALDAAEAPLELRVRRAQRFLGVETELAAQARRRDQHVTQLLARALRAVGRVRTRELGSELVHLLAQLGEGRVRTGPAKARARRPAEELVGAQQRRQAECNAVEG